MNGVEAEYALILETRLQRGEIVCYKYERTTLHLADQCRYTPDFMVELPDGTIEFHEVKGWRFEDDALVKIKVAAEMFGMYVFRAFVKQSKKHGGGWKERRFE
jgi:hypothetical protein